MQHYIGTKAILARPMTRGDYNVYRDWELPKNEDGADDGYLVEYIDGGKPNDYRHAGYISWSPKAQFENAYQPNGKMSFGHALVALEHGQKVARSGWNGKGMWLEFVGDASTTRPFQHLAWIGMKTADDKFVPWLASQTDMLAKDWVVLE